MNKIELKCLLDLLKLCLSGIHCEMRGLQSDAMKAFFEGENVWRQELKRLQLQAVISSIRLGSHSAQCTQPHHIHHTFHPRNRSATSNISYHCTD